MKYKKFVILLITCLLTTSLLFPGTACAQDEELPDPGITPDSPFYFFDKLGKNIGMFFTFGSDNKARKALRYAEERLAEARVMAERKKAKALRNAADDYDEFMAMANKRIREIKQQDVSENITERIALAISKHLSVLERVKEQVPEEAGEAIARAREACVSRQVNALRELANTKLERALDISRNAIDEQLERARKRIRATDNTTADIDEALDYAERISQLEDEMAAIAEEKGIDITAVQRRLARSTSNRLEVLSGVYERVPAKARPAIENAIENSVRKYERTVDRLVEKNAIDAATVNATAMLRQVPAKLRERVRADTSNSVQDDDNDQSAVSKRVRVESRVEEQNKERVSDIQPRISLNRVKQNTETVTQNMARQRSP